jgi:hypothetical protein
VYIIFIDCDHNRNISASSAGLSSVKIF